MATSVEREPRTPEGVEVRPEEFTAAVEKAGATPRPSQFTAQVTDDAGKPLIQTPQSQVTLQVPASAATLTSWSKGPITSALTWFGAFWLRILKKAVHFGWKVIGKNAS